MGCDLPVITSTKCGTRLIEDGRQGFVRDALDIAGLARAMRLLCNRARAQEMGAAAACWPNAATRPHGAN